VRGALRRLAPALALALALAGCARYSLVEPRTRTVGDLYTVEPQIPWSAATDEEWEVWTVDGPTLQAVRFLNGLADGKPLFRARGDEKRPVFRKDMTPTEISELVADSLAAVGAQKIRVLNLRPAPFGGLPGFRFDLDYSTRTGLDRKGSVAGAVVKDRLYLILYTGLAEHYYDKHREAVERLIESVRMK
jgi:hypothetical protein